MKTRTITMDEIQARTQEFKKDMTRFVDAVVDGDSNKAEQMIEALVESYMDMVKLNLVLFRGMEAAGMELSVGVATTDRTKH